MRISLKIVFFFILGLILAFTTGFEFSFEKIEINTLVLYLLMFLVGVSLGVDKKLFQVLKNHDWRLFLLPLLVIIGSLLGAALCFFIISDITLYETLTVASGFGYYSLSSILIAELHSENLASVALLSNIIREVITLLFAPFLVKFFGKYAPIASGGATSMDTSLPIIIKFSGKEMAFVAVFSGLVLTALVPVLVTLFLMF